MKLDNRRKIENFVKLSLKKYWKANFRLITQNLNKIDEKNFYNFFFYDYQISKITIPK